MTESVSMMSALDGTMDDMSRPDRSAARRQGAVVGRAAQLDELAAVLDEVATDGSRLVLIGGEAGSGKTTLLEAFAARLGAGRGAAGSAQLVQGQCVALGGEGLPYAPIVGALRGLLATYGRDQVLEWAGPSRAALGVLLPGLVPGAEPGESVRLQLFEAVARLLEHAGSRRPLVLVVEDIHWADESTRHLLRFLARALTDAAVLVVATYRTDELTRRHPLRPFLAEIGRLPRTVRIDVEGLDRDEVGELLCGLLGRDPSPAVVSLVHRRSEGIPYFVEELARSAARGCVEMPDTLRDALIVRIQAMSDQAQDVVALASVGGQRIDHELLQAVAELPDAQLEAGLREAVDAAVLRTDEDGYVFRHALLREVVHEDLLPGQHARLHGRFAAVLEARPDLVGPEVAALEIAHHYSASHQSDKAFRWSVTAATSRSAAYYETLKMYERALDLWDQVDDPESIAGPRANVLERAAQVAWDAGEHERALALIHRALEETGPEPSVELARRMMVKSKVLGALMRLGAVESAEEAVAAMPASIGLREKAQVLNQLSTVLMLVGQHARAVETAEAVIEAAVAAGSVKLEANGYLSRGSALVGLGREQEGLADLVRGGELAAGDTRTIVRYYVNYSDALHLAGRYDDAAEQALAGIEVARSIGLERSLGSMLAGNAAEPLIARGEWDRAARMIARALELDPPLQHRAHLRMLRAWLLVWQGRLDDADALLAEFRSLIQPVQPAPQYASGAIRVDAEHALAVGDAVRAWDDLQNFLDRVEIYYAPLVFPLLALSAAAARRLDAIDDGTRGARIGALLDSVRPTLLRPQWEPLIRAELSDTTEEWRVAYRHALGRNVPAYLAPYAGLRLAHHLGGPGDRAEVRSVLAESIERSEALGAALVTDRLSTLARQHGLTAEPRPDGPALAELTPRELEVLRLVAEGRTNGEIGTTLFISTKTASVHVSNILAKLGVSGRGEAAAIAHRQGLVGV
ncbi:helix-turn-helix transcriptional regulator [Microlunatus ginsengisoli]|uniref:LuxR family transcriptional regulator n=1 Tax=Microlunatus ginsengisoli TaxID=363863 RepID=A0ABP6ZXL4_9ACTN